MKFIILICLSVYTQLTYSQIFKIATAHKMLTSAMTVDEAKKVLSSSYNFIGDGGLSNSGDIAYNFEAKNENQYSFSFLYSTAFDRIAYIQFYDDMKQIMNYRNQFLKLGFTYIDTKYSKGGSVTRFGYRKGKLLYVVELGAERGQCKVHLSNEDF